MYYNFRIYNDNMGHRTEHKDMMAMARKVMLPHRLHADTHSPKTNNAFKMYHTYYSPKNF